jgi:hypothetical protein
MFNSRWFDTFSIISTSSANFLFDFLLILNLPSFTDKQLYCRHTLLFKIKLPYFLSQQTARHCLLSQIEARNSLLHFLHSIIWTCMSIVVNSQHYNMRMRGVFHRLVSLQRGHVACQNANFPPWMCKCSNYHYAYFYLYKFEEHSHGTEFFRLLRNDSTFFFQKL